MNPALVTAVSAPLDTSILPGPIVLLGAPGVGKGTQAKLLTARFGIPQISTGDILRGIKSDPAKVQTPEGSQARTLMDQGQLVPDELVNKLVAERLNPAAHPDISRGFILDGYPRTAVQSVFIERLLAEAQTAGERLPLVAIDIVVEEAVLLRRITGRRSCALCKHIYNIYSNPPRVPGICDSDGSPLEQRSDDTEAAFRERMKEYRAKTAEVIRYFGQKADLFRSINGDQPMGDVNAEIIAALQGLRARNLNRDSNS